MEMYPHYAYLMIFTEGGAVEIWKCTHIMHFKQTYTDGGAVEIWKCTHIMHFKQTYTEGGAMELWIVPTLCTSNKNTNVPALVFSNDIHGGRSYGAMELWKCTHIKHFKQTYTEGEAIELWSYGNVPTLYTSTNVGTFLHIANVSPKYV